MKLACLALAVTLSAGAQFSDLAVTDDGRQIYFITALRLRSEAGDNLPRTRTVYRYTDAGVERFAEPFPLDLAFPRYHEAPRVSGGGTVVAYTSVRDCVGGSTCFLTLPPTRFSTVAAVGQPALEALGGTAQISRNGRWILHYGRWTPMTGAVEYRWLIDRDTGHGFEVGVWPANTRQAITDAGQVLGTDRVTGDWILWSPTERRPLAIPRDADGAVISADGSGLVYWGATYLHSPATGTIALSSPIGPVSLSNDGTAILFVQQGQAFVAGPMGNKQLTDDPSGIGEAVLAGFGNVAVAFTGDGRLLRIDTFTGAVEELLPATPELYVDGSRLAPGSLFSVRPASVDDLRVAGRPLFPLVRNETDAVFQVPWDLEPGERVLIERPSDSPFDAGRAVVSVARRAPYFVPGAASHWNFTPVTGIDPARPGDVVHLWAVGLGAVDESGRVIIPFDCRIRNAAPPEVLYAGMAPGMPGLYQISLRLPAALPSEVAVVDCGTPDVPEERHGVFISTPRIN